MESQVETQELENESSANNLSDIFDLLSGVGLFGGVVGSFFGNAAFATIPLSFSLALQMANRRQLKVEMAQVQQTAIMQLTEQINNNKSVIFEQFNQSKQETNNQLGQQNQAFQAKVNDLSDKLQDAQQSIDGLMQEDRKLNEFTNALNSQQQQVEEIVKSLQQIENLSQVIRSNPDGVEAYYQRGLSHQKLGDKTGAIEDYTEALHLDSTYAKAYHSRGILLAELGSKKQAVEDLRLAAKYYFEQGDIESYEQARNLSKEFYEVRHSLIDNQNAKAAVSDESMIKEPQSSMIDLIAVGHLFDDDSDPEQNVTMLG
ncbi:tetratricopeptide repeat protein [Crocosphaera sp. XPORK-15E]|uniref:tetratricopeptide repeat protein n=1 Tax=Crocosphaera sp. XPORK-15E TaxID=3110247 RepID=UPI002B1F9DAD|nr:tetratricopeptide repeat protein [Crocosphaera sp. XPORK-15E]MEA5533875.1 tetratricopeptide repeat protein [Crocosphaera sp. XPORK-15E]